MNDKTKPNNAMEMTNEEFEEARSELVLGHPRNGNNRDRPSQHANDSPDALLKAAAQRAGMIDLDALKLADLTKVKLNDKGEIDALIGDLKKSKPHLFSGKSALGMTKEEWAAARRKAISNQG
jgi:hypothetical protein